MKNVLITGSNGQLGSELQELRLQYPGFCFFYTDIDSLDLCNKDKIVAFIEETKIDYIINCAAYTAVDKAEDDVEMCGLVNRDAVKNLGAAAYGKAKVIHISTDYVFDGRGERPYKETDPVNPQSVYGKSKRDGEMALLQCCPESIIIRTSWLYSTFGNNFVKTMIRIGQEKDSLNVVADQSGTPTYAADLATAILDMITWCEEKKQFPSGIYHYSNDGVCSWYEFTLKIHQLAGIVTCKVNPITTAEYPTKAARPQYSVLDKTKIKKVFDLQVPSWESSLQRFNNKYYNHQ